LLGLAEFAPSLNVHGGDEILEYAIRRYRDADHAQLGQFWQLVFNEQAPHNFPARIIADKLAMPSELGRELLLICECEGRIVGTTLAGWDGHRGWLYAVAVHPDCRRLGLGAALVRAAEAALAELGCNKINLQIRAGNEAVANFYRALGYAVEARTSMGRLLVESDAQT